MEKRTVYVDRDVVDLDISINTDSRADIVSIIHFTYNGCGQDIFVRDNTEATIKAALAYLLRVAPDDIELVYT